MASMMKMKVLCIMAACMVLSAPYAEAVSCGDVANKLTPCLTYLRNGGSVSSACCNGVKGLNSLAKTTADKKTTCTCLKSAYKSYSGIKSDNASGLPRKCGVSIAYKISPSTDCNNIK
ncbi:hypothetical protein R6Q59_036297 [Mikania micrantha]|uniref:Non-specific lipid-transfer protein n=1 Tax=Mikania micrantha TaxID=192012 RepID=A0A5N6NAQ2_9ASTR|nr:hypothetical protein E3N88_22553 [Mikania micrantha]